jgi:uncharacterized protein YjbI with pentapeptide repeats
MNLKFKEKIIPEGTSFSEKEFDGYDFTNTNLTYVIFKNVHFSNCIFCKTMVAGTKFWCCFFDNCSFKNINLTGTYLGAWGGGQSNCQFDKCKFGGVVDASYLINCTFNECRLKTVEIKTHYVKNVKFAGVLDDIRFSKFNNKEIGQYQTIEKAKQTEEIIKTLVGKTFDASKISFTEVDFSDAKIRYADLSQCELYRCIPPVGDNHILIEKNANQVASRVKLNIERNWSNKETKSWALACVKRFENTDAAIISYSEFEHMENRKFAEELMLLFKKYVPLH